MRTLSTGSAASSKAEGNDESEMAALLRAGDPNGALATLARAGSAANVRMANMQFNALLVIGHSVEAAIESVLATCTRGGFAPSQSICVNVLHALDKHSTPEAVLAWLARMREAGMQPDTAACNVQLKAIMRLTPPDFTGAAMLLSSMMRSLSAGGAAGFPPPDEVSFNTVITAMGTAGRPDKAEDILHSMLDAGFAPSRITFTAVVSAFARARRPADAARTLWRMIDAKVLPDAMALNTALSAYANAADVPGTRKLLAWFEEHARDELPCAQPDLISYNTLLLACARAEKPAEAEAAFAQLLAAGLQPNQVSYSTVLNAHAKAADGKAAQAWLDRMAAAGLKPDVVSYNTVCSAHAKRGDAAAALRCVERMRREAVEVTPTTHAILIHALTTAGELDAAVESLRALVFAQASLSAASFNALISAQGKAGRIAAAEATFGMMLSARVEPSLVTFNALASAHAAAGDLDAVERVCALLAERRLQPDHYTYGALLQACIRAPSSGARAVAKPRVRAHVEGLLRSRIPLNEFLTSACTRAVGDKVFQEIRKAAATAAPTPTVAAAHGRSTRAAAAAISPTCPPGLHPSPPNAWGMRASGPTASASASASASALPEPPAPEAVGADEELAADVGGADAEMSESDEPLMDPVQQIAAAIDEDGWETARSARRNSGRYSSGSSGGSSRGREARASREDPARIGVRATPNSAIKKQKAPPPKPPPMPPKSPARQRWAEMGESTSPNVSPNISRRESRDVSLHNQTEVDADMSAGAMAPAPSMPRGESMPDVRLLGVPLTRSRSDRLRLLRVAQQVMAAEGASGASGAIDASGSAIAGLAFVRSKSEAALGSASGAVPPALPLMRSAASELALTLGSFAM